MKLNKLEALYKNSGATFLKPISELAHKINSIKAFVFDWDGVFNNGHKFGSQGSSFSEIDSMGTNLLRYAYFLKHASELPIMALISGEKNEPALFFAERECWNTSYSKTGNKLLALEHLCENHSIQAHEIAYFFDDVLDLPIAQRCGLRFLIDSKATLLFKNYVVEHQLADYITRYSGSNHGVRECTELCMGLMDQYQHAVDQRMAFSDSYKLYLKRRLEIKTQWFTQKDSKITRVE